MAFRNLIDDSSTTVTANTPGVTLDLRNHGTVARPLVPVRLWVYAASTVAGDTGVVAILDSTGAAMATANVNGTMAQWYAVDGTLPATSAKYDAWYGNNTVGSLTVYAFSLYEYSAGAPVQAVASWTLGALTVVGTGTAAAPAPSPEIRESVAPTATTSPSTTALTQIGDLVIIVLHSRRSGVTHTIQSGYTNIISQAGAGITRTSVAYKVAASGGANAYTPYASTGSADVAGIVVLKAGTFTVTGLVSAGTAVASAAAPDAPSVTAPNGIVLAIGGWLYSGGTVNSGVSITAPSGYTEAWESNGGEDIEVSLAYKYTSGSENPGVFADNTANISETTAITIGIAH